MSLVGNLEELGIAEIFQIVSLSRKTGVLALNSRGREGRVVFRLGQVVKATSTTHQQSLGEVLIQKGFLQLSVLRKALAVQQENGFREHLGTILINHFRIDRQIIEEVVREQIQNVVFALFAWVEGKFEFRGCEDIETIDDIKLDPLQFMLESGLNPQFLAMEGTRLQDQAGKDNEVESDKIQLIEKAGTKGVRSAGKNGVVIVDDDGSTLRLMADCLKGYGFDVHSTTRSEDTLIKIDELCRSGEKPTVIIDLIMPKMDGSGVLGGIELLELLHNNFRELPIIVTSDYRHAEAEQRVAELGRPFIMKPRRSEISKPGQLQSFISTVQLVIKQTELDQSTLTEWQKHFNLGEELRHEMGQDDDVVAPAERGNSSDMTLLKGMLEELNNPHIQGGEMLLLLRFASEFMNRAILFGLDQGIVCGMGQFGISDGKTNGDAKVRSIHFALEAGSIFWEPYRTTRPRTFKPDPNPIDSYLFDQLGAGVPEEVFVAPICGTDGVRGFLYGDNLPDNHPIKKSEILGIFLSQAGIAIQKNILDKRERVDQ